MAQPPKGSLEEQLIEFAKAQGERYHYKSARQGTVSSKTELWVAVNQLQDGIVFYRKGDGKDAKRILVYEPSPVVKRLAGAHINAVFDIAARAYFTAADIVMPEQVVELRWVADNKYDPEVVMTAFSMIYMAAKMAAQDVRSNHFKKAARAFTKTMSDGHKL